MKLNFPLFGLRQGGQQNPGGGTPSSRITKALLTGLLLMTVGSTGGCLNRPICGEKIGPNGLENSCVPQTTNVIVQKLIQQSVDKIDMLFVIDNSISMADKQAVLVQALPDLVKRFVSPICVNREGVEVSHPETAEDSCPADSAREFSPIDDIHIGVITTSLGGYGSPHDCVADPASPNSEQKVDMAHLLGSLPRGAGFGGDFLAWTPGQRAEEFGTTFGQLVAASGEHGCGWEASLEAWYRFLIEPAPYVKIERVDCPFGGDTSKSCIGPTTDQSGKPLIDTVILEQRRQFLRPDSLVAIIMLSDENDCSFRANGQSWRLAQAFLNEFTLNAAFKGTATCASDPNNECCHSCGAPPPSGCPTAMDGNGKPVGTGCDASKRYDIGDNGEANLADQINLRCFQQKRRFGVDYLYPVERYSNALKYADICTLSDDLDPSKCAADQLVRNPLYDDLQLELRKAKDPAASKATRRPDSLVFLAGIVGVPWQDVAVSANVADKLVYRVAKAGAPPEEAINWNWIVGDPNLAIPAPEDPLMLESVEPRTGTNPATGEPLAAVGAGYAANSINGHEWNIAERQDLQYACIFPKALTDCAEPDTQVDQSVAQPNCDCTDFGASPGAPVEGAYSNPLCQAEDGTYDRKQRFAKAYPSLRQLQVLRGYGNNSIVASICPKEATNTNAADYGYRPAVASIVDRLKEELADKCLPRPLGTTKDGLVACKIIEAQKLTGGTKGCGDPSFGGSREEVPEAIKDVVRKSLEDSETCSGPDCRNFRMCEIKQLSEGAELLACLNDERGGTGNGWCYIDADKGIGNAELVKKCQVTEQRKLRFVNKGTPDNGTVTFVACAGAVFDGT